jgi:hypothetical protein
MIALVFAVALAQSPCADHAALMSVAADRAAVFDLKSATTRLAEGIECPEIAVAYWYVHGLIAARDAYRYGGSAESLEPVKLAIKQLESRSPGSSAAEIAQVVLQAASAAAQCNPAEMSVLGEHELNVEKEARDAGQPGAPIVSAFEVTGDLWLQVHRFEDAHRAYVAASAQVGSTRRITLGLARTAFRLGELPAACEHYRILVSGWPKSGGEPPELGEARTFLRRAECRAGSSSQR